MKRPKPDKTSVLQLYTMEETAAQLSVSRRWLQDFVRKHPHYRLAGRRKLFSAQDIQKLYEALPRPDGYAVQIARELRALPKNNNLMSTSEQLAELRKQQAAQRAKDRRRF